MERIKKVAVSMHGLAEMVKKHYGLPPDAAYMGSDSMIYMTFKHQTFDLVHEAGMPVIEMPKEEPVVSETSNDDESGPGE
jgi:hypothetical protein